MQIASMKHTRCTSNSQQQLLLLLLLLIAAACLVQPAAGRGGRGRGGGSFGGIFGGWRSKYGSKSSSSGGGRRVVSGSPVHTAMTVPKVPLPPPPPPPPKPKSMPKPQLGNYPRQQLPHGYNYGGYGSAPSQGTYYANTQALPSGAIYYPQPPMGSSFGSGTNDFLTGFLAARLMHSMNRGHYHHVYNQNPNQNPQGGEPAQLESRRIIVINNGQQGEGAGEGQGQGETEAPLQEVQFFAPPLSNEEETQEELSSEEQTTQSTDATAPPVGGIVCFPIMMKETDPLNAEEVREVERIACVPAASLNAMANVDCQNDPQCMAEQVGSTTTSTEPPIVAGDIGSASDSTEEEEEGATAAEEVTEVTNSSQADVDAMLN